MAIGSTEWQQLTFCPTFHIPNRYLQAEETMSNE